MTFIGTDRLKAETAAQNASFRASLAAGRFADFGPSVHFDWWAFPIDRASRGHGDRYDISSVLHEFRADGDFLRDVLGNAGMLMSAWGWDLSSARPVDGSLYPRYGVRLWKCGLSLHVLGMPGAFASVRSFAVHHRESRTIDEWPSTGSCTPNAAGVDIMPHS
jgi:hypothetical protein